MEPVFAIWKLSNLSDNRPWKLILLEFYFHHFYDNNYLDFLWSGAASIRLNLLCAKTIFHTKEQLQKSPVGMCPLKTQVYFQGWKSQ